MVSRLLEPLPAAQWDAIKARHLLNRAGFGVPYTLAAKLSRMGPAEAVSYFLNFEERPRELTEPDWLEPPRAGGEMRRQIQRMYRLNNEGEELTDAQKSAVESEKRKINNELRREERQDLERLKAWWLARMLAAARPLEEKLTLFWHGHFAVSAQKVRSAHNNYQLNKLFRDHAAGNFKVLAYEVGCSPAMLRYLDNAQNNKRNPNENWARELMELFALGVGNYTEEDIKNSARAFTGWATDGEDFVYRPGQHDNGEKVFMGRRGNLNGNDIFDVIFEQPAAAEFIATKLWRYFAYEEPEPEVIEGLAATLRRSGFELAPMLRQLLRSRAFYSEAAIGTQIKSPAQLIVSTLSLLEVEPNTMVERYVLNAMRLMGQDLFYPPNVKGWDGGRAWINTNTLMTRYNLSNFLVQGVVTDIGGNQLRRLVRERRQELAKAKKARRSGRPRPDAPRAEIAMGGSSMEMGFVGDATGPKGFQMAAAPFDAPGFFARADGIEISEIADFLADYFYGAKLTKSQRREVIEALAGSRGGSARLNLAKWDKARLRAAVHLMLSTADFQLC